MGSEVGPLWDHYSLGPFPLGDLRELLSWDVKLANLERGDNIAEDDTAVSAPSMLFPESTCGFFVKKQPF